MNLERFHHLKKQAVRALREGQTSRARVALSEVADILYQLGTQSSGKIRAERFRDAKEMREAVHRLSSSGPDEVPGSVSDEDDEHSFRIRERPQITFEDVAGLEHVKEEFRLKLVYPFQHPEKAEKYRLRRGGGVLLYGPPGTGKTMLARALAGEIDAAFFTVKPSEILSKWVGEAEKNVEELFDEARSLPVSVIFVDEIDALAPRRRENTSPVMARLVPQILAELEGFDREREGTLLFLGATNEPWLLDQAILRPGRFDERIYVGLPDAASLSRMLQIHLSGRPLSDDFEFGKVAAGLSGFSGADVRKLCERAASEAFLESVHTQNDRVIGPDDVLRLASEVLPSVSSELVARYKEYAVADEKGAAVPALGSPARGPVMQDH